MSMSVIADDDRVIERKVQGIKPNPKRKKRRRAVTLAITKSDGGSTRLLRHRSGGEDDVLDGSIVAIKRSRSNASSEIRFHSIRRMTDLEANRLDGVEEFILGAIIVLIHASKRERRTSRTGNGEGKSISEHRLWILVNEVLSTTS